MRKWRFAHVRQPNRLEYRSNSGVFGQSFDVLSGIAIGCEFDVMCFFAAGLCASIRACAYIRTFSVYREFNTFSMLKTHLTAATEPTNMLSLSSRDFTAGFLLVF